MALKGKLPVGLCLIIVREGFASLLPSVSFRPNPGRWLNCPQALSLDAPAAFRGERNSIHYASANSVAAIAIVPAAVLLMGM